MLKKNKEMNMKLRRRIRRMTTFLSTFLIIYFVLLTAIAPQKYDYKEGDIALSDIKAPRDTIDEDATQNKLNEALAKVEDKYTVKVEVKNQAEEDIESLFGLLQALVDSNTATSDKIAQVHKNRNLSDSECTALLSISKNDINTLRDKILVVIQDAYKNNIQDGVDESLAQAKNLASSEIDNLKLNNDLTEALKEIVLLDINSNLFYDEASTKEVKNEVKNSINSVVIKKNQIIVNEGEPITASQIKLLKSLGLLKDDSSSRAIIYTVLGIFLAVILYIQNWYIYRNYKNIFHDIKKMLLISIVTIISVVVARALSLVSPYLIPVACAPLLITLLINYKISIFVSITNLFFIAPIVGFDPQVILLDVLSTLLGATFIRKMQQRNDILYASIFISIITAFINLSIGIFLSNDLKAILLNSGLAIGGTMLACILAIGLLPILESTFDVVTTLKLLELSNPNSPLLKRLLMEAPGTYHHSMLVANLAEMVSDEVGANSVITRIGAYYHDVGKIERPYFFKENQITKENPHDNINANLSTLIIVSHVKDGVELAKEYNLPQIIIDIIREHHGTTLVKYFYYIVKSKMENEEDIDEDDYKYPGPIPSSKESGIIMLADSTEAAVRSISDPTSEKIEKMINDIIDEKLRTGQLDNCDLTLKDISKIRVCFLKALNGIYHKRIEYPSEDKK